MMKKDLIIYNILISIIISFHYLYVYIYDTVDEKPTILQNNTTYQKNHTNNIQENVFINDINFTIINRTNIRDPFLSNVTKWMINNDKSCFQIMDTLFIYQNEDILAQYFAEWYVYSFYKGTYTIVHNHVVYRGQKIPLVIGDKFGSKKMLKREQGICLLKLDYL